MRSHHDGRVGVAGTNGLRAGLCLLLISMLLAVSCGGGGGGGDATPSFPQTGTMFTTSEVDSVAIVRVNGATGTALVVDSADLEVYSGTATLNADNTFSMNFTLYPTGGPVLFTVTGEVDASGNFITAVLPGDPPATLTVTTNSLAGVYYGNYSGTSSGIFVAGVDGSGNMRGFSGNDTDGWESFSTTGSGSSFTATGTAGTTISGSVAASTVSGTFSNPGAGESGVFSGPKVF